MQLGGLIFTPLLFDQLQSPIYLALLPLSKNISAQLNRQTEHTPALLGTQRTRHQLFCEAKAPLISKVSPT